MKWNFEKFLVAPDGKVVGSLPPAGHPRRPALVAAIEANLPS